MQSFLHVWIDIFHQIKFIVNSWYSTPFSFFSWDLKYIFNTWFHCAQHGCFTYCTIFYSMLIWKISFDFFPSIILYSVNEYNVAMNVLLSLHACIFIESLFHYLGLWLPPLFITYCQMLKSCSDREIHWSRHWINPLDAIMIAYRGTRPTGLMPTKWCQCQQNNINPNTTVLISTF